MLHGFALFKLDQPWALGLVVRSTSTAVTSPSLWERPNNERPMIRLANWHIGYELDSSNGAGVAGKSCHMEVRCVLA